MRVLSLLTMLIAIAFMIGLNVVLFLERPIYGIAGIVGLIGYFIAYAISVDITVSPNDFWFQSSWEIFKKKIGYAFSTYLIVTLLLAGILRALFG